MDHLGGKRSCGRGRAEGGGRGSLRGIILGDFGLLETHQTETESNQSDQNETKVRGKDGPP